MAQGSAHVTDDLDVCYARRTDNYPRIENALAPLTPRLRGAPNDLPFRLDAPTLEAGLNFTLKTAAGNFDLLGEVAGIGGYEQALSQSEEMELFGKTVRILSLEALIRSKRAAGRPKDLRAIPELEALWALRRQRAPK